MSALYPLRLKPCYQSYLWGGDKIIRTYKRNAPPGIYAESWEVSDRPEGMSVVANGAWAGKSFADVVASLGRDLLGRRAKTNRFPLLIKLIDAQQTLSVQVHPDDAAAARWGGEPKSEMWYTLQAEPGAVIYSGTLSGTTEVAFRRAVSAGQVETLLRRIPVQAGERYYIPGGRIHAIGAGCLLLEVQQNSNTTYRVYDWGRKGSDGQPRPLHIEEAMRVTD